NLERSRGNREQALELCREALELRRELGHRLGMAMSLNNLGHLPLETGDPEGARERLRGGGERFGGVEEAPGAIEAITGRAAAPAALGRHEAAARIMAAMEAEREARGFEPRPCEKAVLKRWQAEVGNVLDTARLEEVRRQGRSLTFEQAVAEARH